MKTKANKINIEDYPIKGLRHTLKEVIFKELETLPETLEQLEPIQRVNVVCKLIPFVLPKVEAVHYKEDESMQSFFEN